MLPTPYDHRIALLDAILEDPETRQPRLGSTSETRTQRSVLGDRVITKVEEIFADEPTRETR